MADIGGDSDDGDIIPLSQMFSMRERRTNNPSVRKSPRVSKEMEEGHGVSNRPEKGERGISGTRSFKTGDIVWANVSPRAWWPGWIHGSKGSKSLVSFFGRGRARFLEESEICGFQENYLQMSEMAGGSLSNSIHRALVELGRRTALGLSCSCRSMPTRGLFGRQIDGVRERFLPDKILGFLRDMAVCAWISGKESALAMATEGVQINAYRRFVMVCPDSVYLDMLGVDSLCDKSEGNLLGMTSDSRLHGKQEDFFSVEGQNNEYEEYQEKNQGDRIYCDINSSDVSIPSSSDKSELLLDGQTEEADQWRRSIRAECDSQENYKMWQSAAIGASAKPDTEVNDTNLFCVRDFCHAASTKTGFHHGLDMRNELMGSKIQQIPHLTDEPANTYKGNTVDIKSVLITAAKISSTFKGNVATLNSGGSDGVEICSLLSKQADVSTLNSTCLLKLKTQMSPYLAEDFSLKHQTRKMDGIHHADADANITQVLHEILGHLRCLALDPFYLRSSKLRSACKRILNFRTSAFEKIPDHYSAIYMSEGDKEIDAWGVIEHDQLDTNNGAAEDNLDYMASGTCESRSEGVIEDDQLDTNNGAAEDNLDYMASGTCESRSEGVIEHDQLDTNNGAAEDNLDYMASGTCESRSEALLLSHPCHDDFEIHASDKINGEVLCMPRVTTGSVEFWPSARVIFTANIAMNESKVADGTPAVKFVAPVNSSGDGVSEGVLKKRRFGQAVASGNSVKLNKTQPLLSDAEPYERPLMMETFDSTGDRTDKSSTQSIQEMLWNVKCLALDPFYLGSRKLKIVRQLLLTYRTSTFHNIPDIFPTIYTTECSEKQETWKVSGNDCLMYTNAAESNADKKDGDAYESRCKTQLSSPVHSDVMEIHASDKVCGEVPCQPNARGDGVSQPSPAVNLAASTSVDNSCTVDDSSFVEFDGPFSSTDSASEGVQPKERFAQAMVSDNTVKLWNAQPLPCAAPMVIDKLNSARGRADKNSNETNMESLPRLLRHLHSLALDPFALRLRKLNHVSEKIMMYRTLVFQKNIPDLFTTTAHFPEIGKKVGAQKFRPSVEGNLVGNTAVDKCVPMDDNRLVNGISPLTSSAANASECIPQKRRFDQHYVTNKSGDNINAVEVNGSLNAPMCMSRDGSCRRRNLEQRVRSDVSELYTNRRCSVTSISGSYDGCSARKRKLDQPVSCNASKLSRLYASPLVKDRLDPPINKAKEYCVRKPHASISHSLHMKFPSGFDLPSKEELQKKFELFGPLDRSRTRVFFYTGAAQVVFLHSVNAEAAYRHAKKLVFNQANVLFWLDDYEKFRRGNENQTRSSLKAEKSTLNIKSSLKRPNVLRKRDEKKLCGVKFSLENQPRSLSSVPPCNVSREVGVEISVGLLQLLKKCDALVCEIKSSMGLQSYYSIFTHTYCCIPVMDEIG